MHELIRKDFIQVINEVKRKVIVFFYTTGSEAISMHEV